MKKQKRNKDKPEYAKKWDFSEGYGGIPENVSLTHNIGCGAKSLKNRQK